MKYLHKRMLQSIAGACMAVPLVAMAADVEFPRETVSYKKSDLPGYQTVSGLCVICHSAQYASSQPPESSPAYWNATVHKMKDVYKAPLQEEMIPAIVEYLSVEYGGQDRAAAHADYEKAMAKIKPASTGDSNTK